MAINKRTGMDLRAINRDQKAIDKLSNKGRSVSSHSRALEKAKGGRKMYMTGSIKGENSGHRLVEMLGDFQGKPKMTGSTRIGGGAVSTIKRLEKKGGYKK